MQKPMSAKAILYVEDEENDVFLLKCACERARLANPLKTVKNGDLAVAYLNGDEPYVDREQNPLPGLVLLDLNLPRRSGMKVLQWIRQQPQFGSLPVVIYTSSDKPKEQEQAMQLGANEYIMKPSRLDKIAAVVEQLKERWLV